MQQLTLSPSPRLGLTLLISLLILGTGSFVIFELHSYDSPLHTLNLSAIRDLIISLGPGGPIAYITLLILSVVISQIPGAPLVILAGTIWPPFWAAIFTVMGGFSGAIVTYVLGRQLGGSLDSENYRQNLPFSGRTKSTAAGRNDFSLTIITYHSL